MHQVETWTSSGLRPEPYSNRHLLLLYLASLAWMCGVFIFEGLGSILPIYFVLAYAALFLALFSAIRSSHDLFNPLALMIAAGFVRFSLPGCLAALGIEPGFAIFETMGIRSQDWMLGHALALMGLLGLVTGWSLDLRIPSWFLRRLELLTCYRYSGFPLAAIVGMLLGFVALALFVGFNVSFQDAIFTGEFRSSEITPGTGKFFFLALLLIASSVVFCAYLSEVGCVWWITILPPAFAMISFSVLGGRVMAFVPMAAAGLVLWYRTRVIKPSMRMAFIIGVALLPVFSYIGQIYRGGTGLEGVAEEFSLSSLIAYMNYAVWVDWGNLHAMAAATMIGPGVLKGRTFAVLFWPLSKFLGLGQSAGVYMAQTLVGIQDHQWGFHATLIGDAYLNFGLIGVIVATIVFGIVLRILYGQIRVTITNTAVYAFAMVYSLRMFFESIEEFPETLFVLGFVVFAARLGRGLTVRPVER